MSQAARAEEPPRELTQAEVLAATALDFAAAHNTPPTPRNFELWYTYASRENTALNRALDEVVEAGETIDPWWFDNLCEEHLSPRGLNEGVANISRRIDGELGCVLGILQAGLTGNTRAVEALGRLSQRIASVSEPDDVERLALHLSEIGRRQVENTRRLGESLDETRAELAVMQSELEDLRNQAFVDHLTQLANRRRLESELARAIEQARADATPLCFAIADIDRFKGVNDTWGHAVGDMVLMKFADILKRNVKGKDTAARFGGEEFALILPDTTLDDARRLADTIRDALGQRWFVVQETGAEVGHVTVSFGVTRFRPDDTMQSLIERADSYLYKAKDAGRDQVWSAD